MKREMYLGDGVYATFDHGAVWLDTRGQGMPSIAPCGTPGIYLEQRAIDTLVEFVQRMNGEG